MQRGVDQCRSSPRELSWDPGDIVPCLLHDSMNEDLLMAGSRYNSKSMTHEPVGSAPWQSDVVASTDGIAGATW